MVKKLLSIILILILLNINIIVFANDSLYVWSSLDENLETSTNPETTQNFFNLESGSAILIEQNTRKNII